MNERVCRRLDCSMFIYSTIIMIIIFKELDNVREFHSKKKNTIHAHNVQGNPFMSASFQEYARKKIVAKF